MDSRSKDENEHAIETVMEVVEADERQREIEGTSQDEMAEAEAQDAAATDGESQPSPPMISLRQEKIKEKRKMAKCNLEAQALRMTRQSQEKFPPGKLGDTVKVRMPDVDRGRCDSRNILGVITEVNLRKGFGTVF